MLRLESSRRPGESRAAWKKRAMRQGVDDASVGKLGQFMYDQLQVKGTQVRRVASAVEKTEPPLEETTQRSK